MGKEAASGTAYQQRIRGDPAALTAMTERHSMDVGQDGMALMVMRISVVNLYDCLTGAWPPPEPPRPPLRPGPVAARRLVE
jgi:hypothetical protein